LAKSERQYSADNIGLSSTATVT